MWSEGLNKQLDRVLLQQVSYCFFGIQSTKSHGVSFVETRRVLTVNSSLVWRYVDSDVVFLVFLIADLDYWFVVFGDVICLLK